MMDFLKNLFGTKKKPVANINIETAPLSEEQLKFVTKEEPVVTPSQLLVGIGQSVGRQRDHNEDSLFYFNSSFANDTNDVSFGIFIVADGMGGHEYGEVASSIASKTLGDYVVQKLYSPLFNPNSTLPPSESIQEIIENGIKQAQNAVMQKAPGGGTTITAGLILGDQITIGHVGDSRLYFIFPDGRIEPKTNDHSLVKRLVDLGQITEAEAKNHPNKNVLYRALGQSDPFRPDITNLTLPKPGYVLICSDGLWGLVNEDELFRIATSTENPSIACTKMVDAANKAGGPDNISVILVKIM